MCPATLQQTVSKQGPQRNRDIIAFRRPVPTKTLIPVSTVVCAGSALPATPVPGVRPHTPNAPPDRSAVERRGRAVALGTCVCASYDRISGTPQPQPPRGQHTNAAAWPGGRAGPEPLSAPVATHHEANPYGTARQTPRFGA